MNEIIVWLVLFVTVLIAVLVTILLVRIPSIFHGSGKELRDELRASREEARTAAKELRLEVSASLQLTNATLSKTLETLSNSQQMQLVGMSKELKELTESNQSTLDRIRSTFDTRAKELREGNETKLQEMRKELGEGLQFTSDTLSKIVEAMGKNQQTHLEAMSRQLKDITDSNQVTLDQIRKTLDGRVKELQESNEKKLDEMRRTVDEKLHDALEKRLGESFKLVSDRLEAVHKGLGEMQNLAIGIGDLKRVLTNVKARGTWAEVQLGAILEQILTAGQYEKNVRVKVESLETIEYAVRLPGLQDDPEACVWLPIDSKFPQEDYLRLQEAAEKADPLAVQKAIDALARTIRTAAKDIHEKYVNPPSTTDFGIMFLATEGLYAEVLRQPSLVEDLLHRYRVVVAGPATLAAILSSLRVGFQTLAIEQRAAEVWRVLGAVKTEFGRFSEVLDKVKRQLNAASNTIEETGVRTRAMAKRLRSVEELPQEEATRILDLPVASILIETGENGVEAAADEEKIPS